MPGIAEVIGGGGGIAGGTRYCPTIIVAQDNSATPGYRCDGAADNVQIQAAVDALPASGGRVHVKGAGDANPYDIQAAINVDGTAGDKDNVAISGDGDSTALLVAASTAINCFTIDANNRHTIRDLKIDGNRDNQVDGGVDTNQNGVYLNGALNHVRFINLTIIETVRCGIHITGAAARTQVTQCRFRNVNDGVRITGSHLTKVDNSAFTHPVRYGVAIDGTNADYRDYNNSVVDCHFALTQLNSIGVWTDNSARFTIVGDSSFLALPDEDIAAIGVKINDNADYSVVEGNVFYTTSGAFVDKAVFVTDDCWFCTVADNTIQDWGASDGIGIRSHFTTISGNAIEGVVGNGIALESADYCTVSENNVSNCTKHGIYLKDSDWGCVTGNTTVDNDSGDTATYDGIFIDADSDNGSCTGNTGVGNDRYQINCAGDSWAITGNRLDDTGATGNLNVSGAGCLFVTATDSDPLNLLT